MASAGREVFLCWLFSDLCGCGAPVPVVADMNRKWLAYRASVICKGKAISRKYVGSPEQCERLVSRWFRRWNADEIRLEGTTNDTNWEPRPMWKVIERYFPAKLVEN